MLLMTYVAVSSCGVGEGLRAGLHVCYSPPLGRLHRMEGRSWAPGVVLLPIFHPPCLPLHVSLLLRSPFGYSSATHLPRFVCAACKGCVVSPHLLTLQHSCGWWNAVSSLPWGWDGLCLSGLISLRGGLLWKGSWPSPVNLQMFEPIAAGEPLSVAEQLAASPVESF